MLSKYIYMYFYLLSIIYYTYTYLSLEKRNTKNYKRKKYIKKEK